MLELRAPRLARLGMLLVVVILILPR